VQNIDGVRTPREADHAVCAGLIQETKLFDALANDRHRFEIVGLFAALNLVELESGVVAGVVKECSRALEGVAQEADRTHELVISNWI
jgi:hypothetical protein